MVYAAFLGGLIFGFLPYRFAHLDHLNLLSIQWLPLCLLFLTRYLFLTQRTTAKVVRLLAGFWGCYVLQVLTSFNYLFMLTYVVGIVLIAHTRATVEIRTTTGLNGRNFGFSYTTGNFAVLTGACLIGLLLLPFAFPYFQANQRWAFNEHLKKPHRYQPDYRIIWSPPREICCTAK
jgi:hypothetical protein